MNPAISTRTAAVIISFNPNLSILQKILASLVKQCPVVIVDNGSAQSILSSLGELVEEMEYTELLALHDNEGIAHAQNTGIKHINEDNTAIKYVLMLDHDSIPLGDMVTSLEKTFKTIEEQDIPVAAVGPVLYDPRNNSLLKFHKMKLLFPGKIEPEKVTGQHPIVEVDGLNSSGTLISLKALHVIGHFDSMLFIDHVETDWCFRARAKGFKLFATTGTRLTHHMGDDVCYYWFFGKKSMPYRSPSRHYYLARNSLLLQKRKYIPVSWKVSNILKLCFTYVYFGFFTKESTQQRKCILLGIRDGMKGITGRESGNCSQAVLASHKD
jgi:rhamnosyltransferase